MSRLRAALTTAALLLVALIPSAAMPANGQHGATNKPPVATLVAPEPPDAYKPSPDEVRKQIARNALDRNPDHYQCRDYPEALQPSDLIPTANVAVRISFDHHTGRFETIEVDPRVIISYETRYETTYEVDREPNRNTPGAFATDHYSWTLEPGVEMYGVFVRTVDARGYVEWTTVSQLTQTGMDNFTAYRHYLDYVQVDVWIVATDITNCHQDSNPLPGDMWNNVELVNSTDLP